MAYQKRVYTEGIEEVTYQDMNRIEEGIEANDLAIDQINSDNIERDKVINAKETPEGAQSKSDAALKSAKEYTDEETNKRVLQTEYDTKMAALDSKNTEQDTAIANKVNNSTFTATKTALETKNTEQDNAIAEKVKLNGSPTNVNFISSKNGKIERINDIPIKADIEDGEITEKKVSFIKSGVNLYNEKEVVKGYYCNTKGIIAENINYCISNKIPIKNNQYVTLYRNNGEGTCTYRNVRFVTFYDKSGNCLGGYDGNTGKVASIECTYDDSSYCLVTFLSNMLDNSCMIVVTENAHVEGYTPAYEYFNYYIDENIAPANWVMKEISEAKSLASNAISQLDKIALTDSYLSVNLSDMQNGYGIDNGTKIIIVNPENSSYKHFKLSSLKAGTYYLSGVSYKNIRLFYIVDDNDNIIYGYPKKSDVSDSTVYEYDNVEITLKAGQHIYLNKYSNYDVAVYSTCKEAILSTETKNSIISEATAYNGNTLYGKKWAVCGDSFSHGDFTNATITDNTIADGIYKGKNKVYGYLIGNRNNMTIQHLASGGRTIAMPADGSFTNAFSNNIYKTIDADVDYITLYFGINDSHHRPSSNGSDGEDQTGIITIGTIDDTETSTFYGAWNVVLEYLITNYPYAHIGILVSNGCETDEYRVATIAIANKWGIPYIDLNGDERTPIMNRSTNNSISSVVRKLRTNAFATGSGNGHPSSAAHEYESYFIENFLRSI